MLLLLALASVLVSVSSAQTVDGMIGKYAYNKGAVTVTLPETVLRKMARRDDNDLLRKLTEIKVISITAGEDDDLRASFMEDARRLTGSYDVLYSVSNDGKWVSAYLNGECTEAITLSSDDETVTLLYMKGDIDDQMQDAILNNKIRIKKTQI